MQISHRRWHVSDVPFLDIETTPYRDGTVNIRLVLYKGVKPGLDRNYVWQNYIPHVMYEDDIQNTDVEIMRNVRVLKNAATLMAKRGTLHAQLALPVPRR